MAPRLRLGAVVPARDHRELLGGCLQALESQSRPLDEIVVVDNASSDGTAEMVRRRFPRVNLVEERTLGVDAARNRGIAASTADVLLFTDADCVPPPGWAAALERCFEDPAVAGAGGPTEALWDQEPPGAVKRSKRLNSYLGCIDFGGARRRLHPESEFLVGANMAWRREALAQPFRGVYKFPPTGVCAEDVELSRRIARESVVLYEPAALVRHRIAPHKTRLGHLLMRGFCFSAARSLMNTAPRRPLWDFLLWELPIEAANVCGTVAGALARRR